MPWVFDASIAMAWCFVDERTSATSALLDRLESDPADVPGHWHLEVANVLAQALRGRTPRLTYAQRHDFLTLLRSLPIRTDDATHVAAWDATLALADKHGLSVYDAAYLELALRRGVELATLDKDLRAAAKSVGVPVLP